MQSLKVRSARADDKATVLDFCQRTWDWGDYIPEVWDNWLADPQGRLLVGEIDGQVVAVGHARLVSAGEGWLQGLRIHPEYRGRRLALHFTRHAAEAAFDLGAAVVRLTTLGDNKAIHRVMEELDFQRVGAFVSQHLIVTAQPAQPAIVLGTEHLAMTLDYLARSAGFIAIGRLEFRDWTCCSLTSGRLHDRLRAGEVVARIRAGEIAALAFFGRTRGHEAVVEFADGQGDDLGELVRSIAAAAAARGVAILPARVPDVQHILDAFRQTGFARDDYNPFVVFEKRGGPGGISCHSSPLAAGTVFA